MDHKIIDTLGDSGSGIKALHDRAVLSIGWHSTKDRPLYKVDERGYWECTSDGDNEFIGALKVYNNKTNETRWEVRHYVVEDEIGLCIVGDGENIPAGWELSDIELWCEIPNLPAIL